MMILSFATLAERTHHGDVIYHERRKQYEGFFAEKVHVTAGHGHVVKTLLLARRHYHNSLLESCAGYLHLALFGGQQGLQSGSPAHGGKRDELPGSPGSWQCHSIFNLLCRAHLFGVPFNECKSLVYLKASSVVFVEMSSRVFDHLHHLSWDWHVHKTSGEVLRGVDRSIVACNQVMHYLFLWLVPALGECIVVSIIFASSFNYLPLALAVFSFDFVYLCTVFGQF